MAKYMRKDMAYDYKTLADWYLNAPCRSDYYDIAMWTKEHLEELLNDFYVFPKDITEFDVVSMGVLEQVMWERDVAIGQLAEYGIGFGEKKRDLAKVKHGKWELKSQIHKMFDDLDEEFYVECPFCHRTEYVSFELTEDKMLEYAKKQYPYCHCGAKMDGNEGV